MIEHQVMTLSEPPFPFRSDLACSLHEHCTLTGSSGAAHPRAPADAAGGVRRPHPPPHRTNVRWTVTMSFPSWFGWAPGRCEGWKCVLHLLVNAHSQAVCYVWRSHSAEMMVEPLLAPLPQTNAHAHLLPFSFAFPLILLLISTVTQEFIDSVIAFDAKAGSPTFATRAKLKATPLTRRAVERHMDAGTAWVSRACVESPL